MDDSGRRGSFFLQFNARRGGGLNDQANGKSFLRLRLLRDWFFEMKNKYNKNQPIIIGWFYKSESVILNLFQDLPYIKLSILIYLKTNSNKRQILKNVILNLFQDKFRMTISDLTI